MPGSGSQRGGWLAAFGLGSIVLLAFALRAGGLEQVFPDPDTVVFRLNDPYYHARRALWTLLNFPRFLVFDPYLNYPDGAYVPWPPLLDFAVAAVSGVLGGTRDTFERVAAWTPPLLGALTVLPIYRLGCRARGAALGLGAAAIFACLPVAVDYGGVGRFDHHVAQALLGVLLIALYARALDEAPRGRASFATFAGLALVRAALMLVWQGNLLYLVPGETALLLYGALSANRPLLRAHALSAVASGLLVAPIVALSGNSVGGAYSAIELSRLHLLALGTVAAVGGLLALWEASRPAPGPRAGVARLLGVSAVLGLALVALPQVREGLAPAFDFLGRADLYGARNLENQPLFTGLDRAARARAETLAAWYAPLVPLAPVGLLWLALRSAWNPALLLLAAWTALTAALGLVQTRYLLDFAPVGCVGLALIPAVGADALRHRWPQRARTARAGALLVGALLLWPAFRSLHVPRVGQTLRYIGGAPAARDRALFSPAGSLLRFAEAVRAATPVSGDPYGANSRPEYGILCYPFIGHVLHYTAERATSADPFGPYVGLVNFVDARGFFSLTSEREALAVATRLGARYVATSLMALPTLEARSTMMQRLQAADGTERPGVRALEHFRLITEGPKGGVPLLALLSGQRSAGVPHKLFEVVAGAELIVAAPPGTRVDARVQVLTPAGRRFEHGVSARADERGEARLRLPYATRTEAPARPTGPYRISLGAGEPGAHVFEVHSDDADVREGRTLRTPAGAAANSSR